MPPNTLSAHEVASGFSSRRRTIALIVVAMAFIMDLLDSTIVNIAIPSIQHNLGASYTTIQWLVAGYSLTFALLLITGGRMGDIFGYKKVFSIGVAGFTLASLLSGMAWDPGSLIVARLIQGSMAALMVPQVMSLMQVMYKKEERASINGIFGALAGVAASLGPVIGGLLIQANLFGLDWRPIFLINVPVGIFALIAANRVLPDGKSPHPLKLDWIGTGLVVVALSLLVFPLIQGRELGWPVWTFIMMAASVPLLVLFGWYSRRRDQRDGSALIVPSLFRLKTFTAGLAANVVFESAMIGFFLVFTLVLQIGLGFSVIKAALIGIPTAVGISLSIGLLGQILIPKLGRYALNLGAVIMASGLLLMNWTISHYGMAAHGWQFAPALLTIGFGMGLIMAPIFAVVLNDIDHRHAGAASGMLNAVQQVGGAMGVAIIGVIFFGQLTHQAAASVQAVTPQIKSELTAAHVPAAAQGQIIAQFGACFHDRTTEKDSSVTPASCQVSGGGSGEQIVGTTLENAAKEANTLSFQRAFRVGMYYELSLLAVIFAMSFLLPRHIRQDVEEFA